MLDERLAEAISTFGAVPGVRGLILAGSVGRGEPWPLSDIDILPISAEGFDTEAEIERRRASLVDWWAASARAQTLDVGWLRFTDQEVGHAIGLGAAETAQLMADPRWFHGMDKAYGGRGVADSDGLAEAFAQWATRLRFEPLVVAARVQQWKLQVEHARARAIQAIAGNENAEATLALREAARALRLVLLEGWGERLSSMGREWTRFERMASQRGAGDIASRLAALADARPEDALRRASCAPAWLQERIDLAYAGRMEIAESVTVEENARDQLAAFAVHVPKRTAPPWGMWLGIPARDLGHRLAALDALITTIDRCIES
ncbi:MAG TPA: nucleotidyltransferase domain-containing protein [Roseiflexaceae bacterium]|nr:nucleotidyltransferase domain-containing protein [Roseiflexaceae bacterium]